MMFNNKNIIYSYKENEDDADNSIMMIGSNQIANASTCSSDTTSASSWVSSLLAVLGLLKATSFGVKKKLWVIHEYQQYLILQILRRCWLYMR